MNSPETRWGSSGLAWLTGMPGGTPDFSRSDVLHRADETTEQIRRLLGVTVDAAAVMTERAPILGLTRRGRISAGGASRIMRARDGWFALTLSRPDDIAAVPALVQGEVGSDPWIAVESWAATRDGSEVMERGCLLDLPVAVLGESRVAARTTALTVSSASRTVGGLLVADLTSMWAGPLCGQILAKAGAVVVKVESPTRPDGTRRGERALFDAINNEKLSYAVNFEQDGDSLRRLLEVADVVLEGSRPGALNRRGLSADAVPGRPGRVWLRITGYGQESARVAFGDDAAVAGGLVGRSPHGPVFCADAVADPLSGLEAALAIAESIHRGGGEIIDIAMAGVAAEYAALPCGPCLSSIPVSAPRASPRPRPGPELGADNARVEVLVHQRLSRPC